MKYIRTKEKIMEIPEDKQHLRFLQDFKQADTIEELCDEFVSITEDLTPEILVPKYISPKDTLEIAWKNRFEDEMCYKNVVIKGAIWTDKGLIYKAKMKGILPNGEIDWELL